MEDLIQPIFIMCVGLSVATMFYLLMNQYNKSPEQQNTEGNKEPETTYESENLETYIEKSETKNSVNVSFNVWQGFKFGFGLGLGLILATGFFWIVLSSFMITTLTSFMNTMTF